MMRLKPGEAIDADVLGRLTRRVVADETAWHTTVSPLSAAAFAELPVSSRGDVTRAVAAARAAQPGWASMPVEERAQVLLAFHRLVLDRQSWLLDLIQLEAGKARRHAFEEVADCAVVARHYGRRAGAYLRERRVLGALPVLTQVMESRHPMGVVGIVSPWNYPLSLAMTDAMAALVAGNAVVLRPDLQASVTALAGVELLYQAGLPAGVLQVVLGPGDPVGQAVVEAVDYVCFTGSTATGRTVAKTAGARLVGASLELGGKNSLYVRADADVPRTVRGALHACFSSAGQLCIGAERVLVHDDVWDAFVPRFVEAARAMRLGVELEYGPAMGSLVSQAQLDVVTRHVEDARAKGARVLCGGRARPDVGPFVYEPTILDAVTPQMECRDTETFGPVVSLYRVASDDVALALANDTDYGLNASIWTRDVARGRELAARIRAGTVNINEGYAAAWGSAAASMGGMKDSGVGRRHGAEGLLKYTETQNVAAQRVFGFAGIPGMSDAAFAGVLTGALRVLKGLRVP